jgi:thioesterase domain-containing protein
MAEVRSAVNPNDLRRTEQFLHAKIPLTRAMGLRVVAHGESFAVEAPVALNYNHLHTAFGGSINAVATLAAYTFMWLRVGDESHVVVRESTIRFERPIRDMIRAHCQEPTADDLRLFDSALREKGKGRISLIVVVEEDGAVAAQFSGTFVATGIPRRTSE